MQDIIYHGKKALLLTTEDFSDKVGNYSLLPREFIYRILTARKDGYSYVIVLTSLPFNILDRRFRDMTTNITTKCYISKLEAEPLEKASPKPETVKVVCDMCNSTGRYEDIEYQTKKPVKIVCPCCNGKGYLLQEKFVEAS